MQAHLGPNIAHPIPGRVSPRFEDAPRCPAPDVHRVLAAFNARRFLRRDRVELERLRLL